MLYIEEICVCLVEMLQLKIISKSHWPFFEKL